MIWRSLVLSAALLLSVSSHKEFLKDNTEFWANSLGEQLNTRCNADSRIEDLKEYYRSAETTFHVTSGAELVRNTAARIKDFLDIRLNAVLKIKREAEKVYMENDSNQTHFNSSDSCFYYNSKLITLAKIKNKDDGVRKSGWNESTLPLYDDWAKFYKIPVSVDSSTIHVPTNIYNCSPDLLSNISWSAALDDIFKTNYQNMPGAWQYFASSTGFLRFFPGSKWHSADLDVYDARMSEWYTQAANLPKSIVILLDNSGSMTGLRLTIAKTTVRKILESLRENDFFTIIGIKNSTVFIDPCELSNGTLIQATDKNKRRVVEAMGDIQPGEIANFEMAFSLAFEVLIKANETKLTGAQANSAIMLITDGAPEGYKDMFEKYNWAFNKWVRVFSFLVGNDVTPSEVEHVEWIACANKGYYYHIGTMADVHDYVQDYIRVMARPLVSQNASYYSWSGVHLNKPLQPDDNKPNTATQSNDWTRLLKDAVQPILSVSIAMPVYNLKPSERSKGRLLGVAGVDVTLKDLSALIPRHKLGVNGYAFIINNNGFVIVHPDFSPWGSSDLREFQPKPDYQNVDISYLEQEVDVHEGQVDFLREAMINGTTGNITITVMRFYDKLKKRAFVRDQTYYYAPIKDTPYRLAIVRVEPDGGRMALSHILADENDFNQCRLEVANWTFCDFETEQMLSKSTAALIKDMIAQNRTNETFYETSCDEEAIASIIYDARVTRGMLTSWDGERLKLARSCSDPEDIKCEIEMKRTLNIELVVVGTRGGVTRYAEIATTPDGDTSDRDFSSCPKHSKAIRLLAASPLDADYYRRASLAEKDRWVFIAPSNEDVEANMTLTSIMVSRGIFLGDVMMSAIGLQVQFESLVNMMGVVTSFCPEGMDCNITNCLKEDVRCYLLDDNGYVVVSTDIKEVGLSFAAIDDEIMGDMQANGMFEILFMRDYQALCLVCSDSQNVASRLLDPIRYASKVLWWFLTKVALFILEFSLYDWWQCTYYAMADFESTEIKVIPPPPVISPCVKDALMYLPKGEQMEGFVSECHECTFIYSEQLNTESQIQNSSIYYYPIDGTRNRTLICTQSTVSCDRSYAVKRIPYTNLYLLVLQANCRCDKSNDSRTCVQSHEVLHGCLEHKAPRYRQPPATQVEIIENKQPDLTFFERRGKQKKAPTGEEEDECGVGVTPPLSLWLTAFCIGIHLVYR